jgi:hypothetical protein
VTGEDTVQKTMGKLENRIEVVGDAIDIILFEYLLQWS